MMHPFNSLKQRNIVYPPPKIGEGFGDFDMRYRAAPTRALRWRILFWPPPRGVSRRPATLKTLIDLNLLNDLQ